jgi:hypothetical protein
VKYEDNTTLKYDRSEVLELIEFFEYWYAIASRKGQRYTRVQAAPYLKQAHSRATLLAVSKKANPKDLQDVLAEEKRDNDAIAVTIYKMQVCGNLLDTGCESCSMCFVNCHSKTQP